MFLFQDSYFEVICCSSLDSGIPPETKRSALYISCDTVNFIAVMVLGSLTQHVELHAFLYYYVLFV